MDRNHGIQHHPSTGPMTTTTNSNNNSPTLEAGAIQVTVESHTSDPGLQGDIIATRIMSKLRSL